MSYSGPNPVTVEDGGTEVSSFISFSPICGGITPTSPLQSVASIGTTGDVLTSNGPGALPTFQPGSGGAGITTIDGDTGSVTGTTVTLTGGTTGLVFDGVTATMTMAGDLVVANGGTGATTLTGVLIGHGTAAVTGNAVTQHDVLIGGASNAITSVTPSTAGFVLTSNGTGADPSFQAAAGGSVTIDGDTGSITGSTLTIKAGVATQNCGSSVEFVNTGTTSTLNVTDAFGNTIIGLNAGGAGVTASSANNTIIGNDAGGALTSGQTNTCLGTQAQRLLTTGTSNTAIGAGSLTNVSTGANNTALGTSAGGSYSLADSNNITIGTSVLGTAGESNAIRIGNQGAGANQQNKAFVAGINGVTVTTPAFVTIDTGTNQLGTIATTALPYFSLTPYIVGSDVHSQFSTIQAAINQAVTDGASATSPKNIYIKAGTYTENLTLHDGVYLIVFDFLGANQINANFKIAKIVGNATISSSGTTWLRFTGISFDGGAGVPIAITTTGTGNVITNLDLCSCVGGTFFFSCSNSTNGQNNLFLNDCNVSIPLVTSTGGLTNISDVGSLISQNGPSIFSSTAAGPAIWTATNCQYSSFTIRNSNSQGITFIAQNTTIGGTATGNLFEINSSGSFSTIFNACYLSAITALFTSTSTGSASYQLVDTSIAESSIANSVVSGGISASITSGSSYLTTDFGPTWTGPNITGYFGSHAYLGQSVVHTATITTTTLVSIAVPAGTALTIKGQVTGSNAGHTDITGASYFVTCDGTAAAIIGVPLITINASTTGLVTASFSGGQLLIQVTAPSTAAYNWVSSYQVQPLISNT